jgi:hypothetical protein
MGDNPNPQDQAKETETDDQNVVPLDAEQALQGAHPAHSTPPGDTKDIPLRVKVTHSVKKVVAVGYVDSDKGR